MRWSWKLTAQHYRFYPHENITHLTIGPGIDDFSTFKKLAITWFIIDLNSYAVFFKKFNNLIGQQNWRLTLGRQKCQRNPNWRFKRHTCIVGGPFVTSELKSEIPFGTDMIIKTV